MTNAISNRKPVRLSERCGVSNAENSVGSSSNELPAVIGVHYTGSWPKRRFQQLARRRSALQNCRVRTPKVTAKSGKRRRRKPPSRKRQSRNKLEALDAGRGPGSVSSDFRRPIPIRAASSSTSTRTRSWSPSRCRRRRPTPASTRRRATCFRSPTRRRRCWRSARRSCANTSRPSASTATRRRTSSRCRRS